MKTKRPAEGQVSQPLTNHLGPEYPDGMATFNVLQAKTHFSNLLARAEQGEEIIIARAGTPVVRLVPITFQREPEFGFLGHCDIPDSVFFDPLPDEELALWE